MNSVHAREQAGLSVAVAAKRARVKPQFLARLEKHGGFSYALSVRLAALYGCSLDVFLNITHSTNTNQINQTQKVRGEKTPVSDKNVFATSRNVAR